MSYSVISVHGALLGAQARVLRFINEFGSPYQRNADFLRISKRRGDFARLCKPLRFLTLEALLSLQPMKLRRKQARLARDSKVGYMETFTPLNSVWTLLRPERRPASGCARLEQVLPDHGVASRCTRFGVTAVQPEA